MPSSPCGCAIARGLRLLPTWSKELWWPTGSPAPPLDGCGRRCGSLSTRCRSLLPRHQRNRPHQWCRCDRVAATQHERVGGGPTHCGHRVSRWPRGLKRCRPTVMPAISGATRQCPGSGTIRAGTPTAVLMAGTSCSTTALAPTMAWSPMVAGAITTGSLCRSWPASSTADATPPATPAPGHESLRNRPAAYLELANLSRCASRAGGRRPRRFVGT